MTYNEQNDKQQSGKKSHYRNRKHFDTEVSVQTQIESKLGKLFNRARVANGDFLDLQTLGQEGVDHINVNRSSNTRLGFLLSTSASIKFKLFDMEFNSIDNLLMFYRTHCSCPTVATADSELYNEYRKNIRAFPMFPNLFLLACMAYYQIFLDEPELHQAVVTNELPLDTYSTIGNKRERHQSSYALIRAIREACSAVSEAREPRLYLFMFRELADEFNAILESNSSYLDFNAVALHKFHPESINNKFMDEYPDFQMPVLSSMVITSRKNVIEDEVVELSNVDVQLNVAAICTPNKEESPSITDENKFGSEPDTTLTDNPVVTEDEINPTADNQ